jgi:hypothetical protein
MVSPFRRNVISIGVDLPRYQIKRMQMSMRRRHLPVVTPYQTGPTARLQGFSPPIALLGCFR